MLERERHRLILRLVEERSVVSVAELVALLDASEATLRRDINALAEAGALRRVRGGAEALRPRHQTHLAGTPFDVARDKQAAEKRAIARAAAALIGPNGSVIVGAGSTTFGLAEFLLDQELDVLTNSFPIAAKLAADGRCRVTLPGGTLFREQGIVLSPFAEEVAAHFRADLAFTGCHGLSRAGLMETDPLILQSQVRLFAGAERLVVLADSTKLRQRSALLAAPIGRIGAVVTDSGARTEELEPFRAAGIEVIVAVPEESGMRDVA